MMAPDAMKVLCDYTWPGNVRQLRNLMERMAVTVEGKMVHAEDLPHDLRSGSLVPVHTSSVDTWPPNLNAPAPKFAATLESVIAEAEKGAILAALAQCNHHRERAAQVLGISVRTLHYKLNRHMI